MPAPGSPLRSPLRTPVESSLAPGGDSSLGLFLDLLAGVLDNRITFTRASSGAYFGATGSLVTVGTNVPRFAYDPISLLPVGLLIEEQRTNSVRNPRAEGATVGTPGTFPTFWGVDSTPGWMTRTVVGAGTQNGVPYLDVRISGTPSSSSQWTFGGELYTGAIVASNGQTYTGSFYISIAAGSMTNLTATADVTFRNAGGSALTSASVAVVPTSSPTRYVVTCTGADATIAFVGCLIRFMFTNGNPIDLTFRVAAPQIELGGFATSVILPPAGTPAVATRASELVSIPSGDWFNPAEGTLGIEGTMLPPNGSPAGTSLALAALSDNGPHANVVWARVPGGASAISWAEIGGSGASVSTTNLTAGVPFKFVGTYGPGGVSGSLNGATAVTAAGASVPSGITALILGAEPSGQRSWNGYLRRIRYWMRALTVGELKGESL